MKGKLHYYSSSQDKSKQIPLSSGIPSSSVINSLRIRNQEFIILISKLKQENSELKRSIHELNSKYILNRNSKVMAEQSTQVYQEEFFHTLRGEILPVTRKSDEKEKLNHKFRNSIDSSQNFKSPIVRSPSVKNSEHSTSSNDVKNNTPTAKKLGLIENCGNPDSELENIDRLVSSTASPIAFAHQEPSKLRLSNNNQDELTPSNSDNTTHNKSLEKVYSNVTLQLNDDKGTETTTKFANNENENAISDPNNLSHTSVTDFSVRSDKNMPMSATKSSNFKTPDKFKSQQKDTTENIKNGKSKGKQKTDAGYVSPAITRVQRVLSEGCINFTSKSNNQFSAVDLPTNNHNFGTKLDNPIYNAISEDTSRSKREIKRPISYKEPSLSSKLRKGTKFFKFESVIR